MKSSRIWQLVGLLSVMAFPAFAQIQDVQITATKKKLDEQKSRDNFTTTTTKEIVYVVNVQNKRFATLPEIQVKYMIVLTDAKSGSLEKAVPVSHRGSETLKNLSSNASVSFETKPIKLSTEELDGNVYWANGADGRARDKVNGVWIRAYADGKMIGEYANPTSVTKKNEWRE